MEAALGLEYDVVLGANFHRHNDPVDPENLPPDVMDAFEELEEEDYEMNEVAIGRRYYGQEFVTRALVDPQNPLEVLKTKKVREKYRFFPHNIYKIVDYVTPRLEQRRKRGPALPPLIQVVLFLRYLATGESVFTFASVTSAGW